MGGGHFFPGFLSGDQGGSLSKRKNTPACILPSLALLLHLRCAAGSPELAREDIGDGCVPENFHRHIVESSPRSGAPPSPTNYAATCVSGRRPLLRRLLHSRLSDGDSRRRRRSRSPLLVSAVRRSKVPCDLGNNNAAQWDPPGLLNEAPSRIIAPKLARSKMSTLITLIILPIRKN